MECRIYTEAGGGGAEVCVLIYLEDREKAEGFTWGSQDRWYTG